MAAKGRRFSFRQILTILIVLLIIIAIAYYVLSPKTEQEDILSVHVALKNKEFYNGKAVSVRGVYSFDGSRSVLQSTTTDAAPYPERSIYLDLSALNTYELLNVSEGNTYIARGVLEIVEPESGIPGAGEVQIVVTEMDAV